MFYYFNCYNVFNDTRIFDFLEVHKNEQNNIASRR